MIETLPLLEKIVFPAIRRSKLETLQLNIGYKCNQTCVHCHVNAGPTRTEMMSDENLQLVPRVLKARNIKTLDITGGAPELHERFRWLVQQARNMNIDVIDRCNLTILSEPGQEDLALFLAENQVQIYASLPCYSEQNVDQQRGKGVFEKSISALLALNEKGYGMSDSGLEINLVYNPQGPTLPPPQAELERDYKLRLAEDFGIHFNHLVAITNMPIKRFGSLLVSKNQFHDYMSLLKSGHNDENLKNVMCRSMISVDWNGELFDCDFNQQLGIRATNRQQKKLHLRDLLVFDPKDIPIKVAGHCFGCTAGAGSSCGGELG